MRLTDKYGICGSHPLVFQGYYTTEQMSGNITYYDEEKFTNVAIEKLGELEDLLYRYGIESLIDLNVILAEYFANVQEHSFPNTLPKHKSIPLKQSDKEESK